jgi:glutamate--cysteine ligase
MLTGVELEWLPYLIGEPSSGVAIEVLQKAIGDLSFPSDSSITFEPGAQVELSSPPSVSVPHLLDGMSRDSKLLFDSLRTSGIGLLAMGLRPWGSGDRYSRSPRYDAMESFFDADGDAGRTMMRDTAALHINIDLPTHCDPDRCWRVIHALAPVLAAAFANSPFRNGALHSSRSQRQANWLVMDPTRCSAAFATGNALADWVTYVLRSRVMLIRTSESDFVPVLADMSFERWLVEGHELGFPDLDDLRYHLTTLFPPVRPRGWLELRMIDALPAPWWRVATLVTSTLLSDEAAFSVAERATERTAGLSLEAAQAGLNHPVLAAAARRCFNAALSALDRCGLASTSEVQAFSERFVEQGRTPADERVARWQTDGSYLLDEDQLPVMFDRAREASWS